MSGFSSASHCSSNSMRALMPLIFQVAIRISASRHAINRIADIGPEGAVGAFNAGIAHRYHREAGLGIEKPVVPVDSAPAGGADRLRGLRQAGIGQHGAEETEVPAGGLRVGQLRDLVTKAGCDS